MKVNQESPPLNPDSFIDLICRAAGSVLQNIRTIADVAEKVFDVIRRCFETISVVVQDFKQYFL